MKVSNKLFNCYTVLLLSSFCQPNSLFDQTSKYFTPASVNETNFSVATRTQTRCEVLTIQ